MDQSSHAPVKSWAEEQEESKRVRDGLLFGVWFSGALVGVVWLLHLAFGH